MSKLLVVFGATGNQGGSVIASVLNDPVLSKEYKIRAITRDPSKPAAETLQQQKGVEVVKGDADDKASLKPSLQGAHTVFSVTASVYDDKLYEREIAQGKAIADAAIATGAQYIIYSTLPSIEKFSGGKFKNGAHFNVKYDVEQYIVSILLELFSVLFDLLPYLKRTPFFSGSHSYMLSSQKCPLIYDLIFGNPKYQALI